ncbi:acyl-CoA dehydrogenase family protein [Rhabdothermincola sp.]|uniref:acyl-CoA dehydrogenase family protein n=1 Tax=Rhabdothermincola sp. TaxID=2820405 RepID=UPI002FE182A3
MDIEDTPEEAAFRAEARAWLETHAIPKGHPDDFSRGFFTLAADWDRLDRQARAWQRHLFDGGWAGISYPKEYGGRGGTTIQELIFAQEMARFGVHNGPFAVAHTMVGPAILEFGTEDQRERFIEPMLRGDEEWCQLFSEPGAGSDLASLTTRAVRDGDEWVVNGQKVWTSSADRCEWGILLARTDPAAPRHRGITYFLLDMSTPGIDIRPLRQMTGDSHFSEVFLTDVRIPAANVLGGEAGVGNGWRAAMHTLANERNMIGSASADDDVVGLLALAREAGRTSDPLVRQELARVHTAVSVLTYLGYRMQTALSRGQPPGPETSVLKLRYGQYLRHSTNLAKALLGAHGMLDGEQGRWSGYFGYRFVWAPHSGIAGGTNEVQRNIIAERVLGLPGEPRPPAVQAAVPGPATGDH